MTGLWLLLLWAPAAEAAVRVSVAPQAADPVLLAAAEAAVLPMLDSGVTLDRRRGLVLEARGWSAGVTPERRRWVLSRFETLLGAPIRVEELASAAPAPLPEPAPAGLFGRGVDAAIADRLRGLPTSHSKAAQDGFYDRTAGSGDAAVSPGPGSPAPARPVLTAAAARAHPRGNAAPPAPAAPGPDGKVSWWRAAREMGAGAVDVVRSVFTWKGAAIVAGTVAMVAIAPVTVYGLLVLSAGTAGYTIGKALYDGYQAKKAGETEKLYEASRDMGRGLLTLGLTFFGARNPPTNLRPHVPKTLSELRVLAAAMDDEPIVVMSLLGGKKANASLAAAGTEQR
ncbi:MAG: hypothetical protein HY553_01795 [Elusimicrobia bacterium]|nr:hypothetical protein [Elusimicrobiota bacterium]